MSDDIYRKTVLVRYCTCKGHGSRSGKLTRRQGYTAGASWNLIMVRSSRSPDTPSDDCGTWSSFIVSHGKFCWCSLRFACLLRCLQICRLHGDVCAVGKKIPVRYRMIPTSVDALVSRMMCTYFSRMLVSWAIRVVGTLCMGLCEGSALVYFWGGRTLRVAPR